MDNKLSVTAYVSSKNRYFTTLPTTIYSIINQSVKIDKFVLYQDGEKMDLRTNEIYSCLFNLLDFKEIKWEVIYGQGKGQLLNHQHMLENAKTDLIYRVDDDGFPEYNALQYLLEHFKDEKVGAVGGIVPDPRNISSFANMMCSSKIEDVRSGINVQWVKHKDNNPIEVDHLYSSFIYRKEAGKHGYNSELSPVAHREETIFTYEMKRSGWKLLVDPRATTWHFRQSAGGIREYKDTGHWDADEKIFNRKMKEWGVEKQDDQNKMVILDNGKGDHIVFKRILPDLKKKYKNIVIAACYPEVFEEEKDMKIISIGEAQNICKATGQNEEDYNIYKFCIDQHWTGTLENAFRRMYL
jgi:hypothetical protein